MFPEEEGGRDWLQQGVIKDTQGLGMHFSCRIVPGS